MESLLLLRAIQDFDENIEMECLLLIKINFSVLDMVLACTVFNTEDKTLVSGNVWAMFRK